MKPRHLGDPDGGTADRAPQPIAAELPNPLDLFLAKIERRGRLSDDERASLRALPQKLVRTPARRRLVAQGEKPVQCCMVLEGMACRIKTASGGRRQIVSFHLPGDMVDLHTILFKVADYGIETVRRSAVVLVPHEALLELGETWPAIGRALWYDTLLDAAIQREALLNIGRRDAYSRTAHLFCEFAVRFARAGLSRDGRFILPLTQTELADALSVTPIHMNRMLMRFRQDGLLAIDDRTISIPDPAALKAIGEFDPTYLHLESPATGR